MLLDIVRKAAKYIIFIIIYVSGSLTGMHSSSRWSGECRRQQHIKMYTASILLAVKEEEFNFTAFLDQGS